MVGGFEVGSRIWLGLNKNELPHSAFSRQPDRRVHVMQPRRLVHSMLLVSLFPAKELADTGFQAAPHQGNRGRKRQTPER